MVYNKSNTPFTYWWELICKHAFTDYNIILQLENDSTLMYVYYEQGMDIEEAMINYNNEMSDEKNQILKMHKTAERGKL